jgi:hypothetical protein
MSMTSKVMYSVRALDKVPKDTGNDIEPTGSIFFLPKLYNGFDASFNYLMLKPISSKVDRNNISAWLPLSTKTLITFHLSMCVVITIASMCGNDMSLISASVKVNWMCDHLLCMIGPSIATWLTW